MTTLADYKATRTVTLIKDPRDLPRLRSNSMICQGSLIAGEAKRYQRHKSASRVQMGIIIDQTSFTTLRWRVSYADIHVTHIRYSSAMPE